MLSLKIFMLVFTFISRCRFPRNTSIPVIIRSKYGNGTLKTFRKLEKYDLKYRKTLQSTEFLLNCKANGVIPRFLEFKTSNPHLKNTPAYHESQLKLLHQEIGGKNKLLVKLSSNLIRLNNTLKNELSYFDHAHTTALSYASNCTRLNKIQIELDRKLSLLIEQKKIKSLIELNPEKTITNYSQHVLTESQRNLLLKGLNFAVLPKKLNYADFCINFELFYRDINNLDNVCTRNKDFLKSKLKDIALSTFRDYHKQNNDPDNLSRAEFAALKELADDHNIVIQKCDKGNGIAILDKTTYIKKVSEILSDTNKFQTVQFFKDEVLHIIEMEKRIKSTIKKLLDSKKISKKVHDSIYPIGSRPGILYGLAKTHSPTNNGLPPFRPILSAVGTPTYNLAKFLLPIMSKISLNDYTIKNSFHFAREVVNQDSSQFMASFDVKALFTSIPLDETIQIAADELFSENETVSNLSRDEFVELLTLATKESCFLFNGQYYTQIDGVAMGNPLGPTMANIFMAYFEKKWINDCSLTCKPTFYRRYVDDIFVLFNDKDHLERFKEYLNSRHPNIRFTHEVELNDTLSFLDINVIRNGNIFETSVYRKKTFTGVYTNFSSSIPTQYKRGLIMTLLFRFFSICSNWQLCHIEILKLKGILLFNDYPQKMVDKCISLFLDKTLDRDKPLVAEESDKTVLKLTLPYLGKKSNELKTTIKKVIMENIPLCKFNIIFSSKRRIKNFFLFKDKVPIDLQSHLIYKIQCDKCNLIYYGLTERHSKVRFFDHMGLSILTGRNIKGVDTAMKTHCREEKHSINKDSFTIIGREENSFRLRMKESLLIKRDRPQLNNNLYSTPLYLF